LEWAHVFGRPGSGFGLGAWANSKELTTKLCRRCHNANDRHTDEALIERLRYAAVLRLQEATDLFAVFPGNGDGIRVLIAKLEGLGWRYDNERCELVHEP
jgi:hypothetical protein